MPAHLTVSLGQHSDPGRKPANQDFHGACIPREPLLSDKGIAIALADGISSSEVSHVASESAVKSFLADYYCTSDAWSVKTSAQRVIAATNAWLHAQTQRGAGRFDKNRGHVCTFSAMVVRSNTVHLFHVGDARIYRLHANALEQLTADHRVQLSAEESFLGRALGVSPTVEIDYQALPLEAGDLFMLATDGVYEHVEPAFVLAAVAAASDNLDQAARAIVAEALRRGSPDNLTVQLARIDALPLPETNELPRQAEALGLPPPLAAHAELDGLRIVRELQGSSRSHVYLATDLASGQPVVIKMPSVDMQDDPAYRERFLMEEWVARRIHSDHVLRPFELERKRSCLYTAMEYVEGQTLAQWMRDHPQPDLETVRGFIEQIAKGLKAFHRLEMVHQDLRPENVMIDAQGTLKIIDFGATRVASMVDAQPLNQGQEVLGSLQYTAPECLLGEGASARSDMFSLGIMAHQMLTGRLPYGMQAARVRSRADLRKLNYVPARDLDARIPAWVEGALRKAVHPDPLQRYEEASEFAWDLRHPNPAFLSRRQPPLIQRNPVAFWQWLSVLQLILLMALLVRQFGWH
jgi:serine/threonine protein phosphatase PrpC